MRNLHCGGHFLRFLRSIGAKTACARRAIVALFVVVATILATFMIMPSASMGASSQNESNHEQTQSQTKSENVEPKAEQYVNTAESKADAKDRASASGENGESKSADLRAVESVNPQPSTNPDASNADHAQNVDSEKKQGAAKEGASKNPNQDVKKDAAERAKKEESANKSNRQRREAREDDRAAASNAELPQECKKAGKGIKFFKDCYVLFYNSSKGSLTLDAQLDGKAENISPEFQRYKDKKKKILESTTTPSNTIFKLVKVKDDKSQYMPIPDWVKFKNPDSNDSTSSSDGVITIHPVGKWTECTQYRFGIQVQYPDYSDKNRKTHSSIFKINVNVKKDVGNNDLTLNVYNHEDSSTRSEINGKDGITFESGEDGKYSPITPIFIDSKSTKKPGLIYHHMICHKESSSDGSDDSNDNYTVDKVNGLSLGVKNSKSGIQTQFKHENKTRPNKDADAYAVYENDPYAEESQSLISGTPKDDGTFECEVFAVKNVGISYSKDTGKTFSTEYFAEYVTNRINGNTSEVFKNPDTNIYEAHIPDTNTSGLDESVYKPQKTIDWDVKTIKIVFNSNNVVGENDLKLKVYPFKSAGAGASGASGATAALGDGGTVSVMKGMVLKPFIEATSKDDGANKITLRVLCAKGEKKAEKKDAAGSGALTGDSSSSSAQSGSQAAQSGSQAAQSSGSSQSADDLEYKTWSSKPDGLVLSVPEDTKQTRCNEAGDGKCTAAGVASKTDMEVGIRPTVVGDYQCVVYALKPAALAKFDAVVKNSAAQSGSLTPDSIKSALTTAATTAAAFKEDMDFAARMFNIHSVSNFTLPNAGERNWNLQLGAVAAVMVSVLAAGFVISQSEACRKLLYERRRC